MDPFDRIQVERVRVADELAGLTPPQWDSPSLCSEWRVRDVLAHMLASTDLRLHVMFGRLVRSGFNVPRALGRQAREIGGRPPTDIVSVLRDRAGFRFLPPGAKPMNLMADTVIHGQDVRRPLGMPCTVDPSTLLAAVDFLAVNNFNCKSGRRASGLRLIATNAEWAAGTGPEVRGPLEAIMMAICGRSAALQDLTGTGVELLAGRCPTGAGLVPAS
jgi:uncharacterized protein (TIGR03083 family)